MAYKDPEKKKQKMREYRQNNKDKILEKTREYRQNNKEKVLKYKREYGNSPKGKSLSVNKYAKVRGAEGNISVKHIKSLMKLNKCNAPNCQHTDNLEYDHKIPISKGGLNIDSNLWTLCPNHHREKSKYDHSLNQSLKPDWLDIDYKIQEVEKPKTAQLSLF